MEEVRGRTEKQPKREEPLPELFDENPPFELVKHLGGKVWLAKRSADGEQFLAEKLDVFDDYYDAHDDQAADPGCYMTKRQRHAKGLYELIYDQNISRNISFILNHENLISFVGYLRHKPLNPHVFDNTQATDDYLLWDFCDAGSLELLLVNKGEKPPLIGKSFLPEGLCWHVLTSVMRALTWLHDGYRREVNFDTDKREHKWVSTDVDWAPILHRNITGANILFQCPRGNETYGSCKLADMADAYICNQPADRYETPAEDEEQIYNVIGSIISPPRRPLNVLPSEATINDREQPTVKELRKAMEGWKLGVRDKEVVYSISDDHWALGSVLFRMMTARFLPSYHACTACKGCNHVTMCQDFAQCVRGDLDEINDDKAECGCDNAGCEHILDKLRKRSCNHPRWKGKSCSCECGVPDINIDDMLAQHDYSWRLIRAVRLLFTSWDMDNLLPARSSRVIAQEVELLYSDWRKTPEGMDHWDVEDDVRQRYWLLNADEADWEEAKH